MTDDKAKRPIIGKIWFITIILGAFLAGWFMRAVFSSSPAAGPVAGIKSETTVWTCSMHPQIRQPKFGQCPICAMDLIPVGGSAAQAQGTIEFSPEAVKLMDIETSPVERKFVTATVNMVGKVDYDESRIKNISAWVPGRIDRLYVDFTGTTVKEGDHLVYLYSPQLLSAQSELLEVLKSSATVGQASSDLVRRSIEGTLKAAREKLRLLGLTQEQIDTIEKTGQPTDHLTIYSPIGGIVIEKNAKEGAYVETGQMIYTVADLSRVWVRLDAYESDLTWIRYGQKVEFTAEAYPGEVFEGTISFVDPVLNPETRTVKLRVNADNSHGKLKPQMFVRAVVGVKPASDGSVSPPQLAGKWICPMHPDIVKDKADTCDICGMNLVTAESLGFVTSGSTEAPLVIPATAPLIIGKALNKAVVYTKVVGAEHPTFAGKEVVLGAKAGDFFIVKSGLMEGEMVVTRGAFKIDAAAQIQAMPSMMSRPDESEKTASAAGEQTLCPVMGGVIDKKVFTEYQGKKVYFCCPACIGMFNKDPQKYLHKLPQFSDVPLEEHKH